MRGGIGEEKEAFANDGRRLRPYPHISMCAHDNLRKLTQKCVPAHHSTSPPQISFRPPQPVAVLPQPERLIAIGDLHGDVEATRSALRLAGVLDPKLDRSKP